MKITEEPDQARPAELKCPACGESLPAPGGVLPVHDKGDGQCPGSGWALKGETE